MRVVIAGLGVQGQKRRQVAGDDVVASVDPVVVEADYKSVRDVPLSDFDAALLCIPDDDKVELASHLLAHGKHVLVEKPLVSDDSGEVAALVKLAEENGAICYTAYNHRFDPQIARMADVLRGEALGEIYALRLFYGNGTARLVRNSPWRDRGSGVLRDLGSHLLDLLRFWLGEVSPQFKVVAAKRFENRAYDHVVLAAPGSPLIELEMSLVMWRNHFSCDVLAEKGSAHIHSLCKWGPSTFTLRKRVLPAGRPEEECVTEDGPDLTWAVEYEYFKGLCAGGAGHPGHDVWINDTLNAAAKEAHLLDAGSGP